MEKLNPFLKGLAVLACGLILSFSYSVLLNLGIIAVCLVLLLFFSKVRLWALFKIMLPAVLAAVSIFVTGLLFTNTGAVDAKAVALAKSLNFEILSYSVVSVYNAIQLSGRVLSYACLGVLFALTTDGALFVKSLMHQCRLAPKYAYGVLAAFYLLPTLKAALEQVKLAYKVRGLQVSPFSPRQVFSMLVNTMHWSESVAMAMESKGFDGDGARTFYDKTTLRWPDWCFFGASVLLVLTGALLLP